MNKIEELYKKLVSELSRMRLSAAIVTTREMLQEAGLSAMQSRLDRVAETYRLMTGYMLDGVNDPGRASIITDLIADLRSLGDMCVREVRSVDNSNYYYSTLRFNKFRKENLSELLTDYGKTASELSLADAMGDRAPELHRRKEDLLERLFNALFTSFGADSVYAELSRYLTSGYADDTVAKQAISALTLSLLFFYDKGKVATLLDVYENADNDKNAARALVGIMLMLIKNGSRFAKDVRLTARLLILCDNDENLRRCAKVIKAIVGTRDTERVANKLKEEILPELMKMRPEIMKAINEKSLDPDAIAENNPEWEELFANSKLEEKMREIGDMQSEGADLMMVTFANLKQFPFFNKASNWFLPFDANHSELNIDENLLPMIRSFSDIASNICSSDLFSLAIGLKYMPAPQKDMLSGRLMEDVKQMTANEGDADGEISPQAFDLEVVKTIREYYRFFKLFNKREGFFDPFAKPLRFLDLPVIGSMLADDEVVELIAEFYFKRGFYADALPLLLTLSKTRHDDATLWEKIGYCYQSEGEFMAALEAYDKAALLKTPGRWLTKKLAFVNRCLGNYAEAAGHYAKALESDPENVSLMMSLGNMLLETGDIAGALAQFYHAKYLRDDSVKVMRAIAWAELLNGNFEKSGEYYRRIIAQNPQATDYLNAGHVALLSGNHREALNFYRLSAESDPAIFESAYVADMQTLSRFDTYDPSAAALLLDLSLPTK